MRQKVLHGQENVFKLDIGAETTVISAKTFKTLKNINLQKSAKVLCGPNSIPLEALGQAVVELISEGKSCKQLIYIIGNLQNNLLGLPAITALQLLSLSCGLRLFVSLTECTVLLSVFLWKA